ncbi:MAG TPA: hypothetical protein VFK79_08605 [Xanthobacteraceae bacterium]|nr:hypothetical protein [Xanthobacteraceae bacterium]
MSQHSQPTVKLALPRQFREIRLELAREPDHPAGSRQHGYRLIAPLDAEGHIDVHLWELHRVACRVVRFRPGEDDEVGHLIRRGAHWVFHYDIMGSDDDESGYRFSDERFVVGEYVSIHEVEGLRTFQVTSVEHL